jgi:peptidoglycan hydrolase-like protein with peptidoglycan-binding domain
MLKYDGLDLAASVLPADKVPHRAEIDIGVENVSTAALRGMIAAAEKMNGNDADKQTATQKMMAAAALMHPTIRIYDIAADTQNVGIDITGTTTGSPLSPKGYIADSDIRVRGFDALPALAAGAPMIEYLPLLKELGEAGPATDGAAQVKFRVASAPTKWITINGDDVSEWFVAAAPAPGQTRLSKPAAPAIRGPDVAAVQNALAAANIPVDPTGAYDGPTAAAVARFQKQNSLTVNGVVDAATWRKLGVKAEATPWAPAPQPSTLGPPAAPNEAQRRPRPPAAPNAGAESGVTGVWTAYDVGFPSWTLTLKSDGAKLSGTVRQGAHDSSGYSTTLTMPAAIYDGEINGNKITFKCQDPGHDRTITFTGIVNGDDITFTRTVLVRPGGDPGRNGIFGAAGAARFAAQRVASSGAASAPAKPDQGHRGPNSVSLCPPPHFRMTEREGCQPVR